MKLESLVIADQHAAVNTFPGLVHTARHITKVDCTRSRCANPQGEQPSKVWFMIGVKSKQGSRRRTCGWITSFLRENVMAHWLRPMRLPCTPFLFTSWKQFR